MENNSAQNPAVETPALPPSTPQDASGGPAEALATPFPETQPPPALQGCSYNQCLSGHFWPAILAVARCPGCTGSILAVQKTNCPFCNEPIVRSVVRSDFIPRGGGVTARCRGAQGPGESLDVEMIRSEWQAVETTTRTFLEQEAQEIAASAAKETN